MKNQEQAKARELRSQGMSIKKIAKEIGVSSSSVSVWTRDIELTPEQMETLRLQSAIYDTQHKGAKARQAKAKQQRLQYQEEGKAKAREKNALHMAGCMLYWAEGTKHRSACKFSNSDLNMLRIFMLFLYGCFSLSPSNIRVHINCYTNNGLTVEDIEKHWARELDLPSSCFIKTTTDNLSKYSHEKKAKNKLPYGTVCLTVHDVRIVQHIYGAIQEYAGFNNDYCLD